MRLSTLLLAGSCLVASSFTVAGDTCASATTQAELNECSAQAYQAADDELNGAYQALIGRLNNNQPSREKLRTAQRKWISFRDAECAFESSAVEGGSAQPMVRNLCLAAMTEARTEQLREHNECQEGDLSCPR